MARARFCFVASVIIHFSLFILLTTISLAKEWRFRVKPRGTLKVSELVYPSWGVAKSYSESLVELDRDNNVGPGLAQDWRWINDRTIEFRLRKGVTFHNGEGFNAESVRANWEAYRRMETPRIISFTVLSDDTKLEIIDDYTIRFTLPGPDGLALVKFWFFYQVAPAYFAEHKFVERQWGYLREAGPWGTGPFKFVKGCALLGSPSDRQVLEAYEDYWDPEYPKVERVIFDNTLKGDRKRAMRLCRETEGAVDVVTDIRPLDTLKLAESEHAKVVKNRDVNILHGILNQRKKGGIFRDIRIRKAVNYAINRKELWKYAARGNAYNLKGFPIPPDAYGHNPNIQAYGYNTEKARELLSQAGYPEGFKVKIITHESWKLEAQFIKRMFERIGLNVELNILTFSEYYKKWHIPFSGKPAEEQDWDMALDCTYDYYGHPGAVLLTYPLIEECNVRWIEYDSIYEKMWKDMAKAVDIGAQEEKMRQMGHHIYDRAHKLFVYSPVTLYAVNKDVSLVPYKGRFLRLKETSVTENHWSLRGKIN